MRVSWLGKFCIHIMPLLDPRPTEVHIKSPLSLYLSILILVFFSEMAQKIFLIFGMIVDNWNI